MLNYFGLLKFEYDQRKIYTEKIAMQYLNSNKNFMFNQRRHDMSDSFCIVYYYLSLKRKEYEKLKSEQEFTSKNTKFIEDIEKFKYSE